jgi:outer membrane protein assembly factor BamD
MLLTVVARRLLLMLVLAALSSLAAACASGGGLTQTPPPDVEPDTFLYERGAEALANNRWLTAREYFRRLVDTYPTSRYRQDARLGIGDSYLGERRVDSDILAAGEFREFLRFYPLAERADYAQYRLALSQVRQMLSPQRDQTATRDALRELQVFTTNFPNSKYLPEVAGLHREARDRLSESEFLVGRHYFRTRWYPGAVTRLEELLKADPQYTRRDGVYFFLAEAYARQNKVAEARTYYQRLLDEFAVSEHLEDAGKRLKELPETPPADAAPAAPPAPGAATPVATPQAGGGTNPTR